MSTDIRVRDGEHESRADRGSSPWLLLFALFGGTVPWTLQLIAGYSVANYLCGNAIAVWLLHGLTVVSAAIAIIAIATAIKLTRSASAPPSDRRTPAQQRDQFLASGGIILGSLGLMAILLGEFAVVIAGCGP